MEICDAVSPKCIIRYTMSSEFAGKKTKQKKNENHNSDAARRTLQRELWEHSVDGDDYSDGSGGGGGGRTGDERENSVAGAGVGKSPAER